MQPETNENARKNSEDGMGSSKEEPDDDGMVKLIKEILVSSMRIELPIALEDVLKNRTDDFISRKSPELWKDFNFIRQLRKLWENWIAPACIVGFILFLATAAAKTWGFI